MNTDCIRLLPAQGDRVETGPTQFGQDWPGVFLRGDDALWFAGTLKGLIESFPSLGRLAPHHTLSELQELLSSCAASKELQSMLSVNTNNEPQTTNEQTD